MAESYKGSRMTRYARQQILPEVGAQGQARLAAAHVVVVGAGGLGCPALQYLVGAGVGWITVVDPDVVSLSNLHRQTLYREDQIGACKADAAIKTLHNLNSECNLVALCERLTPENVRSLVQTADLVLDCADSFAVSYILSDECLAQTTPLISASALGLTGYVGGFCAHAPSLRAVFPDPPSQAASCATAGVMGPLTGTIGAMQAQMGLSVLLGSEPSPLGQLVTVDLKSFRFGGFRFDGAPEPAQALGFIAHQAIQSTDFVVELRDTTEAPIPVTAHALRRSVEDFETSHSGPRPTPEPNQRAVLTCRSGLRAWQAARRLRTYWNGDIFLIAMGNSPETERQSK
jgi:molybdopterin/thiamine biosynthesis adenylyltransferase